MCAAICPWQGEARQRLRPQSGSVGQRSIELLRLREDDEMGFSWTAAHRSTPFSFCGASALLLSTALAGSAFAQSAGRASSSGTTAQGSSSTIAEIVVTAKRRNTQLEQT